MMEERNFVRMEDRDSGIERGWDSGIQIKPQEPRYRDSGIQIET